MGTWEEAAEIIVKNLLGSERTERQCDRQDIIPKCHELCCLFPLLFFFFLFLDSLVKLYNFNN